MSETFDIQEQACPARVPPPVVAQIREKLMDGRSPIASFAEAIEKGPRTVASYIAQGMPVEYIGRTPYVLVDEALEWLRSRRKRSVEPRRRGRPRRTG